MILLDCTLRDGGYYNSWDFPESLINQYLEAMSAAGVEVVELGLRSLINKGFNGACAYTTDSFINTLNIPKNLEIGVMVNASELVGERPLEQVLQIIFPANAEQSPVSLVRIASHVHEFKAALPAVYWLKERGFKVGFNLMQIADRSQEEVVALAKEAAAYPIDALYFADSMGSMDPAQTARIIQWLRSAWEGALGIHTHDNLGLALSNTLRAIEEGVTWVDATVTGMGRGPGNARTEELAIELAEIRQQKINLIPLMTLIRQHFKPMQKQYGWGTNPYYYLTGKYGIHPSYVQQMLGDSRFSEEDILAVIDHLRQEGGKKFSLNTLDAARHFYQGNPQGTWHPKKVFAGREVLLLGTGPGVVLHLRALENYIRTHRPIVLALNTQGAIDAELIDYRVACHPVRLLADCDAHVQLPQLLITPYSMLPEDVQQALEGKEVLDFGICVKENTFEFHENYCTLPTSLAVAYVLAILSSGQASKILLAGFDGYGADDPRTDEMNSLLESYMTYQNAVEITSLTPSQYSIRQTSVYGL